MSASLDVYLAPWCHAHGLEFICTVLEQRAGASVYAYGDSSEDRQMLECASEKYYRGQLISNWTEVSSVGLPRSASARRAR